MTLRLESQPESSTRQRKGSPRQAAIEARGLVARLGKKGGQRSRFAQSWARASKRTRITSALTPSRRNYSEPTSQVSSGLSPTRERPTFLCRGYASFSAKTVAATASLSPVSIL